MIYSRLSGGSRHRQRQDPRENEVERPSGSLARVEMVETADAGQLDDLAQLGRFVRTWFGCVLLQRQVRSAAVGSSKSSTS